MDLHHDYLLDDDAWLSPSQAARLFPGVSARSVQKWCKDGRIPGASLLPSGRWIIPREGLIRLIEAGTPNPLPPKEK